MAEDIAFCSYCDKCKHFKWCNPCPVCKQELQQFPIDGRDLLEITLFCNDDKDFVDAMIKLHEENIIDYQMKLREIAKINEQEIEEEYKKQEQANLPKCPYCQSTNLKKITGSDRFISVGLFGLASKKVGKQWHCNNCKSDF